MSIKIQKFEDLEIWKEGMKLTCKVYNHMKICKDYGFRDQMQRASLSIPSNIAEGMALIESTRKISAMIYKLIQTRKTKFN